MPWDTAEPWDLRQALEVARALEDLGVYWMEEPLHRGAVEDMAALRKELKTLKIAGGELTREFHEFTRLLDLDCLDVYQPDVAVTLGMFALVRLAGMVKAKGRVFSPHTWGNGVGLMANAHVTAGVNSPETELFLEFPHDPPEWTSGRRDFFLSEEIVVDAGVMTLSDEPGLGLTLNEDLLAKTRSDVQSYV
jgi:L-alanine-DL-glutamate epimerase-like enolase superfamily enzyme